jgi:hypothetical protein
MSDREVRRLARDLTKHCGVLLAKIDIALERIRRKRKRKSRGSRKRRQEPANAK